MIDTTEQYKYMINEFVKAKNNESKGVDISTVRFIISYLEHRLIKQLIDSKIQWYPKNYDIGITYSDNEQSGTYKIWILYKYTYNKNSEVIESESLDNLIKLYEEKIRE